MTETAHRNLEPRQRLGRGLAALLGDTKPDAYARDKEHGVKQIPIEFVRTSARNPRQIFDEVEMEDLAASIRERGIIQPIIVRPIFGANDAYEIVAGERRWRAAQRAGLHTVPVVSLQVNDREALELSIIENVQRSDLSALEEARGYSQLAAEYGYSHADIGRIVGKSRSHVANTLRLLALPEHTRELLSAGALSAGHARALLTVSDPDVVADRVVARGLTVREVESLNSESKELTKRTTKKAEQDPNIKDLANRLSLCLGADVKIRNSERARDIRIQFKDLEQLDFIFNKLMQQ